MQKIQVPHWVTRGINPNHLCGVQEQISSTGALAPLLVCAPSLMLVKANICMGLPMSTFKRMALFFVAQKCKISDTHNRELQVTISQISYKYANNCSFLILLSVWVGTDYLGKQMTLSHIICYIFSTQQSAYWCRQSIPCSPIPGKKTPLGLHVILAIKTLPFQIPFSPKSFGLDTSDGRFPEKWAIAGNIFVHRSIFQNISFSLKAFWIWLLQMTCSLT